MPINPVPERSEIVAGENIRTSGTAWLEFFKSVFGALFGWKRSYTASLTYDFGSIAAFDEDNTLCTVTGARVGDSVIVTPRRFVNGLHFDGVVTLVDTVTLRAYNTTAAPINPASDTFRVIVFQQ